jgi:hypothetical protein
MNTLNSLINQEKLITKRVFPPPRKTGCQGKKRRGAGFFCYFSCPPRKVEEKLADGNHSGILTYLYKDRAEAESWPVNQEVVHMTKDHKAKGKAVKPIKTPAQVLLALAGSWSDAKDAEEIVMEQKKGRSNSKKLSAGF